MKNFQETDFKIEIPNFSKDSFSSSTIFYDLMVSYQQKKWKLVKRYSEFEDLHNKLNKVILNMPYLPAKSLFKLTGVEIEKRRLDLEKYIRALSLRKDIVQLPDFLTFIEFESYTTDEIFSPIELGALTNLTMGVVDFLFIKEVGILFVGLSDTSILSKMDDIFSSFTSKTNNEIRGSVLAYRLEGKTKLRFQQLWKKDFKSGVTCMYWDEALTFLAVGFDDGACECIRISTEHNYQDFDEFCIVRRHTQRITGCGFYSLLATLYTISKDKTLVVTDITKTVNFALEEKSFLNELTYLLVDNPNKRMFISDVTGTIHIYSLDIPLKLFHKIPCEYPQIFSTLSMDIKKRFLLAGSSQGTIYIYELGKPGKEKLISLTSKIEASKNLKTLAFSILDKNLYFNFGNTVIFMDSAKAQPYFSLDKHKAEVVKIMLLDFEKVLITASKDKSIKFWKLKDADEVPETRQPEKNEIISEDLEKIEKKELPKVINPLKDREFKQTKDSQPPIIEEIPTKSHSFFNSTKEFPVEKQSNPSKPLFEDDDNELKGWNNDSQEQNSISYQKPIEKTNDHTNKKTLVDEEEKNDLCGWERGQEEISSVPFKKNPLESFDKGKLVQKVQSFFPQKQSVAIKETVNNAGKKEVQVVKKNKYEDDDDLSGWSH